jgi:tryptophanyl-tRNA synthetase
MRGKVLSGMRPSGKLHLGHLHGALKNWIDLQREYDCFYFAADWHALTTEYADTRGIEQSIFEMIVDWLAVGIDPSVATLFVQSQVKEHAELHLLLSMITPLPWLYRCPSYKEQQAEIKDKDLTNFGFLGYPVLQAADILMYEADFVPVGVDQLPHLELTREIARRFNHFYGPVLKEPQAKLSTFPKIPGTDGRKMSKSYGNAIFISDSPEETAAKIKPMITDPARKRRTDPGDPDKCPVYTLHQIYTPDDQLEYVSAGCRAATIGCLECKDILIGNLNRTLAPIRERRARLAEDPRAIARTLEEGAEKARSTAGKTMSAVRAAVKI